MIAVSAHNPSYLTGFCAETVIKATPAPRPCRAEFGDTLTVTEIDAGHMLYPERTAEVATAVNAFLEP